MNVVVKTSQSSSLRNVHKVEVLDGCLNETRYRVYEKQYKFLNQGSKDIESMFIEHRFQKVRAAMLRRKLSSRSQHNRAGRL